MSEINAGDMPKANGGTFEDVGKAYLRYWDDHGFNITLCTSDKDCFQGEPLSADQAFATAAARGLVNMLMQREVD